MEKNKPGKNPPAKQEQPKKGNGTPSSNSGKDKAGFGTKSFKKTAPKSNETSGKKRPFWEAVAKVQPPKPAKTVEEPKKEHFSKPMPRKAAVQPPQPPKPAEPASPEPMRLNKFIAHCGICARRQAAEYIKQGLVTVNGEVEPNPSYTVQLTDVVTFKGKPVHIEYRKVYILMNKPKDIITTANDEKGRKTVLDLIGDKVTERIFPVGRLDRMTTGLLLLTNDGDLAKKLSHPRHKVQKVYHVTLNKILNRPDFERIQKGLELEDGFIQVDTLHYAGERKNEVEIGLHIGKNRIVRRIFEYLGYEVEKLDRTYFAGLTKKDIGRGHFRHLTEKEVIMLKHFK
ncbi:MAG: rRNA pseudouridine synthase [Lewinellaceae bacterium]|nr:rRNA pseudouridine synthase [Lewinellaceae bacterium]